MTSQKKIIEKVAAGLRRMNKLPDYLILLRSEGWISNQDTICDIPVLHTGYINFQPYSDEQCPFIPCWKNQDFDELDIYNFARGYYEG